MKLNRFMLVAFVLLAIIPFGAVSAAFDDAAADDAVAVATEDLEISASDVGETTTDGDDIAVGSDVNVDSKLSASAGDEKLSAGSVAPNCTI